MVGWVGNGQISMLDIGTDPTHSRREEILEALVSAVHYEIPLATGKVFNIGEDDANVPMLRKLGYSADLIQYEMHLDL